MIIFILIYLHSENFQEVISNHWASKIQGNGKLSLLVGRCLLLCDLTTVPPPAVAILVYFYCWNVCQTCGHGNAIAGKQLRIDSILVAASLICNVLTRFGNVEAGLVSSAGQRQITFCKTPHKLQFTCTNGWPDKTLVAAWFLNNFAVVFPLVCLQWTSRRW